MNRYLSGEDIELQEAWEKWFPFYHTQEMAELFEWMREYNRSASSEEQELDRFEEVWGVKYPLIVRSWRNNWEELSTFFKYPPEIRKLIYTTNMIESYHRQLRKVTKGKSIFPTDEALLKMLYLATMDVTRKWTGRVQNWGQMLLQLSVFFPDRISNYLR